MKNIFASKWKYCQRVIQEHIVDKLARIYVFSVLWVWLFMLKVLIHQGEFIYLFIWGSRASIVACSIGYSKYSKIIFSLIHVLVGYKLHVPTFWAKFDYANPKNAILHFCDYSTFIQNRKLRFLRFGSENSFPLLIQTNGWLQFWPWQCSPSEAETWVFVSPETEV